MNKTLLQRLVDLYAGDELPEELERDLEELAADDADLRQDMDRLRGVVALLRAHPPARYTEETEQRILLKLAMAGASIEAADATPSHWQYPLPINV